MPSRYLVVIDAEIPVNISVLEKFKMTKMSKGVQAKSIRYDLQPPIDVCSVVVYNNSYRYPAAWSSRREAVHAVLVRVRCSSRQHERGSIVRYIALRRPLI